MAQDTKSFDPIWEDIYGRGEQLNRYPFDCVVSFVFRNYPRHKKRQDIRILEIGCGAGNNLWFAAREGFQVYGIDASEHAIAYAKKRFDEEGLKGNFRVGDFIRLPYENDFFDLAIDRGAITCCGLSSARKAVEEVRRVLIIGGRFFCNPYSIRHSSYVSGKRGPDGITLDISAGTLVGVGQICFYGRKEAEELFRYGWKLISLQHVEIVEEIKPQYTVHAEWRIIAEKVGG